MPFDLLELDRIDDLGAEIFKRFERLDILVGNAAILGPLVSPWSCQSQGLEQGHGSQSQCQLAVATHF